MQSFNKIVTLYQLIFKQNDLLGGSFGISDLFLTSRGRQQRQDIYQNGADGIRKFVEAMKNEGADAAEEFTRAMDGVDKRIKAQASNMRDDSDALSGYANQLSSAARGLSATGQSMDKLSLKSKLAGVAVKTLNAALSTVATTLAWTALSWAVGEILEGIDNAVVSAEELAEAAETAQANIEDIATEYKSLHDTVVGVTGEGGIAREFAELSQGVDKAGKNLSLTSDQYERYLELSNQLADLFPTLIQQYDNGGNAILNLSGDVETIINKLQSYVDIAHQSSNADILTQGPAIFDNAVSVIHDLEKQQALAEAIRAFYNGNSVDGGMDVTDEILQQLKEEYTTEGIYIDLPIQLKSDIDTDEMREARLKIAEILNANGLSASGLLDSDSNFTVRFYGPEFENQFKQLVSSFDTSGISEYLSTSFSQEIAETQQGIAEQLAQFPQFIEAALANDLGYLNLDPIWQGIVNNIGVTIDPTQYENWDDWLNAIQTDVIDPITEIASSEAGSALEQLLGLSDNYDIDQSTYLKAVEDLRALITAGYEAVGEEVPESITKLFDSVEEEHVAAFQAYSARLGSAGVDLANLEAANLSMMQQKILGSIDTTAEQQLFNSVTTDTQTVAEQIRSYQAAIASTSAIDAFEGIKESADSFAEYQTTVQEALTTGQLTVEQYESLIAIAPEYADALEMQGQQITLNAEKTQELVAARNEEIASDAKAQRSKARVAYIRNAAVLEDLIDQYNKLSDAERQSQQGMALSNQIDNLIAQQNELSNVANKYALIEAQMSEVAQAYKNYEAAMNYASPEDHWEIGYGALEDLNEGLNSGKMGTAEFQAALDLAIPDDVYKDLDTLDEQGQAIADYVSNVLNPFFTEDEVTGMQSFLDEAVKLGALEKSFDENGVAEYATKADITWEEFADTMGMTVPMLEAMIGMFDAYTLGGNAFRESLDMAGLSEDTKEYLDLLEKQNDLYAERQELVKDSSIDLNGPEIAAIDEQLAANSEQISESAQGLTVDIEARLDLESNIADTEKEISSLKDSLNSVEKGSDEYIEIQSNIAEKQTELDGYVRELDKLGGTPTEVEIEIALGVWEQQLSQAKADLDSFLASNEGNYEVNVDGSFTFDNSALQEEYNGLVSNISAIEQNIEVHVSADTDEADTGLDDMNQKLVEIQDNIDKVSSTGITIKGVTTSVENLGKIETASSDAASEISRLSQEIINLPTAHTTTITTRYVSEYSTSYSGGKSSKSGAGRVKAQGTAHAYGTARAKGTDLFPSNWKLKRPELALTGELGPEMVVRGNEWFLAGENGTEFNQLQKGDIVFNHLQTEQLLNKGAIRGRGKARLQGTLPEEGLALVTGSFSFRKYQTSNWSGGSSGSSSSSTEASYNYNGSGNSSSSSDEDDFKETIDWVEKELDRLQRKIDQTAITAESAYKTFSERNKALASEYDQITSKMEENRKGIARYEAEADSVGLSESYAKLVRDGTIDIETITDEDLKDKIDQYTEWYFLMPLYLVTGGGYSVELLESPKGSQATAQR